MYGLKVQFDPYLNHMVIFYTQMFLELKLHRTKQNSRSACNHMYKGMEWHTCTMRTAHVIPRESSIPKTVVYQIWTFGHLIYIFEIVITAVNNDRKFLNQVIYMKYFSGNANKMSLNIGKRFTNHSSKIFSIKRKIVLPSAIFPHTIFHFKNFIQEHLS